MGRCLLGGVFAIFLVSVGAFPLLDGVSVTATAHAASGDLNAERLSQHVRYLAADEREGRWNGSEGLAESARYLTIAMEEIGLQPAVDDSSFVQRYRINGGVRVEGVIGMRDMNRGYAYNTDYTPLGLSGDGQAIAPLAFAGYGIVAPEHGYDDFAGIDVTGKHVMVLAGEPAMDDPRSPFAGTAPTRHSDIYFKAANCRAHGAVGMILVTTPKDDLPDRAWRVSRDRAFLDTGIPVVQATSAAAQAMLEPYHIDLFDLQDEIDATLRPHSKVLSESRVEIKVVMRRLDQELYNIVGKVPGQSDEGVLVLAHYDGPGMGEDNAARELHPAAGEATGVAAALEIAAALQRGPRPERTVYFAFVSGHHAFSIGAAALLAQRIAPSDRVACIVELDDLGRADSAPLVLSTWRAESLEDRVRGFWESEGSGPEIVPASWLEGDRVAFKEIPVPVFLLRAAPHADRWSAEDDLASIDPQALARNTRTAYELVRALADSLE